MLNFIFNPICEEVFTLQRGAFDLPEYVHVDETFPNCELLNVGLWGSIIGVCVGIVFLVAVCLFNTGGENNSFWRRVFRIRLKWLFVVSWLFSFVVYDVGQYTGAPVSLIGNAPMAMLHAFEAFVLNSDVSAVHEPLHNNWIYMSFFGLSHCFAALVTMMVVLKYFGFNIRAGVNMWWASHTPVKSSNKQSTYIFWGINDATYYLADSIIKWYNKEKQSPCRIVLVRTEGSPSESIGPNSIERLLGLLSLKRSDVGVLSKLECLTTSTYGDPANPDITVGSDKEVCDILRGEMKLNCLARLISRNKSDKLYMFLLSDNERRNIQATINLKKDSTLHDWLAGDEKRKVMLYCHARYNSVHRVLEDHNRKNRFMVNVTDSSHISVDMLKNKVDLHPVNFVEVADDATVSTPFNAMVVGFSEVGQDSVRFLYEFGAFVKNGSTDDHVERSPFHCHVVDKNMDDLAGPFVANAPNIKLSMPFIEGGARSDALITLHKMDCRSVAFYKSLESWIQSLNYIIVATENDELNISLAVRVFKLAIRYRSNMDDLCILVRLHNDDSGQFTRVADHYNRIWQADLFSELKNRCHQRKLSNSDENYKKIIHIFGLASKTYSYRNVIQDDVIEKAKQFKRRYDEAVRDLKLRSGVVDESELTVKSWDEEEEELMQIKETDAVTGEKYPYYGFVPTYTAVTRLRRMQSQNIANSIHGHTKRILASRALHDKDLKTFNGQYLFRKDKELTYEWKNFVKRDPAVIRVLDVLAKTEHLRWNAAHEILGYRPHDDENFKDEAALIHGCVRDWNGLNTEHKSFDYNVVDVTLDIIKPGSK